MRLWKILAILLLCEFSYPLDLNLLKVVSRFSTATYDYYYRCSVCGYSLQWRINNRSAGTHDIRSRVGELVSSSDALGTQLQYSSILFSLRTENSSLTCLDAVLVVTRPAFEPVAVLCRGDREQKSLPAPTKEKVELVKNSNATNAVKLEYVLSQSVIQTSSKMFNTHILVCSSVESQTWRINEISAGGFNGPNQIGDRVFQIFNSYPQVLYREAVLTRKNASSDLISVLLISTTNITSNLTISCRGLRNSAQISVYHDELNTQTTTEEVNVFRTEVWDSLDTFPSYMSSSIGNAPSTISIIITAWINFVVSTKL